MPEDVWANPKGAWGYRSYREYLKLRFPGKVLRKLCLNAGFTCPNLDGKISLGGCTYCNNQGFVPQNNGKNHLVEQWERGKSFLRHRYGKVDGFIAYFQAFSNTYAPMERLRDLYEDIHLKLPECEGVSISTRPDCLEEGVIDLLEKLSEQTFTTLELGLQSDRNELLIQTNRGHSVEDFLRAMDRVAYRKFDLCVHFILGLPGEGDDAPERMGYLASNLPIRSVKIHNLHIMKGTAMELQYLNGSMKALSKEQYLSAVARFVGQLRSDQYCQRVLADAPDRVLVSGSWCQKKQSFLSDLNQAILAPLHEVPLGL